MLPQLFQQNLNSIIVILYVYIIILITNTVSITIDYYTIILIAESYMIITMITYQ